MRAIDDDQLIRDFCAWLYSAADQCRLLRHPDDILEPVFPSESIASGSAGRQPGGIHRLGPFGRPRLRPYPTR